jgi:hypothetical protein
MKISESGSNNRIKGPMSDLGLAADSALNKLHEKEKEKDKFYNINNITNIYINFENGNNHFHSNFKAVNPLNDSLVNKGSNNFSYLPDLKNNTNNNKIYEESVLSLDEKFIVVKIW